MRPYARMLLLLVCMVATAVVLQAMFETSDHTKSERIVRTYRGATPAGAGSAATGATLAERLEGQAPGGVWTSEITEGCRGYVRVRYTTATGEWIFDYDVPQHRIHPGNPAAESILRVLGPEMAPAATGK